MVVYQKLVTNRYLLFKGEREFILSPRNHPIKSSLELTSEAVLSPRATCWTVCSVCEAPPKGRQVRTRHVVGSRSVCADLRQSPCDRACSCVNRGKLPASKVTAFSKTRISASQFSKPFGKHFERFFGLNFNTQLFVATSFFTETPLCSGFVCVCHHPWAQEADGNAVSRAYWQERRWLEFVNPTVAIVVRKSKKKIWKNLKNIWKHPTFKNKAIRLWRHLGRWSHSLHTLWFLLFVWRRESLFVSKR